MLRGLISVQLRPLDPRFRQDLADLRHARINENPDHLDAVPSNLDDGLGHIDIGASRRTAPEVETDHIGARLDTTQRVVDSGQPADFDLGHGPTMGRK